MKNSDFMFFLKDCEERGGKEAAASILFQLSEEEMETNSRYSAALQSVLKILSKSAAQRLAYEKQMKDFFQEIMKDENDHAAKFQWAASELLDIPAAQYDNTGKPIE